MIRRGCDKQERPRGEAGRDGKRPIARQCRKTWVDEFREGGNECRMEGRNVRCRGVERRTFVEEETRGWDSGKRPGGDGRRLKEVCKGGGRIEGF